MQKNRRFRANCQWRSWKVLQKDDTDWYRVLVCLMAADAAEYVLSLPWTIAKKTTQKRWVRTFNFFRSALYFVHIYMEISEKLFLILILSTPTASMQQHKNTLNAVTQPCQASSWRYCAIKILCKKNTEECFRNVIKAIRRQVCNLSWKKA